VTRAAATMGRRAAGLAIALLVVAGCSRGLSQPSDWDTGTVTLAVGERGPDLAEFVFENNRLLRVDFKTSDAAARARIQARLDDLQREAARDGLFIKFHGDSIAGERGALMGAKPKPGDPHYARAIYQRFGDENFRIQVK
jgi:hypothetical protein